MYEVIKLVAPRDKEEFSIWKKFVNKVVLELAVIIRFEVEEGISKSIKANIKDLHIAIKSKNTRPKLNGLQT